MGLPRFHVQLLVGPRAQLGDREAVHAVRVRRLTVGQDVALFDGFGREAAARIVAIGRSTVELAVRGISHRQRPKPLLTLAVALPKGPRQDLLIEKCAELGAAAIIPLLTERSVCTSAEHKLDRWSKMAVAAAKQSGQAWLTEFHRPERLTDVLPRMPSYDLAVVAASPGQSRNSDGELPDQGKEFPGNEGARNDPRTSNGSDAPPVQGRGSDCPALLEWAGRGGQSILAFVGPEGGWTAAELEMLIAGGCRPMSLGPNTLRIETAAIAMAALIHAAHRRSDSQPADDAAGPLHAPRDLQHLQNSGPILDPEPER